MHILSTQATSAMDLAINTMNEQSQGDAFDGSAEPVIYMSDNRMPVMMEFNSTIIYIIFAALVLAFLVILPGVRKTKLTSFLGLVTLLTMGASILLALEGNYWLTGSVRLQDAQYGSLTSETITGRLEVNIGLSSTNVTLVGHLSQSAGDQRIIKTVDYNERFKWDKPERMESEHYEALRKGLPYPILSITEFLSQDVEGFNWMRKLRQAGYFSSLALYTTLASWCVTAVIMCVLPAYLPHMMQVTGALMMSSVWIYALLIQSPRNFPLQLGGNQVEFVFGHTYVATFLAGAMSMFAGVIIFILQINNPHQQVTIMDMDQYVEDQKAMYGSNLHQAQQVAISKGAFDNKSVSHNVIIPIKDIEEHFKPRLN